MGAASPVYEAPHDGVELFVAVGLFSEEVSAVDV